jgi:hypothetical protein
MLPAQPQFPPTHGGKADHWLSNETERFYSLQEKPAFARSRLPQYPTTPANPREIRRGRRRLCPIPSTRDSNLRLRATLSADAPSGFRKAPARSAIRTRPATLRDSGRACDNWIDKKASPTNQVLVEPGTEMVVSPQYNHVPDSSFCAAPRAFLDAEAGVDGTLGTSELPLRQRVLLSGTLISAGAARFACPRARLCREYVGVADLSRLH